VPASTTKTITPTALDKAMKQARTMVLTDLTDSDFLAMADMICKLYAKYLKEELKL
jgi:hypothetical protein